MSKYPECEKLLAVREKSQVIGEFLEWLSHEKKVCLAVYRDLEDEYEDEEEGEEVVELLDFLLNPLGHKTLCPWRNSSTESLLAEFFEVDLKKVEKERRGMLEELKKANNP